MELWFYHLERSSLDQVLPSLLQKTLANGWRALVCSPDPERIKWLDQWLWTWRDDQFLPHSVVDAPRAEAQPILLTTGMENENSAQVAFLLDEADPAQFQDFERSILMFDGADDAAVARARNHWKLAKASDQKILYWKQSEAGKWENLA
jgi:DNA polymerase-3 subunit chi